MSRLELPRTLDAEQQRVFDLIAAGPRGKVEGPLGVWLHSPRLAETAQALGAYCRFGSALEPRLSELAILVCGAAWKSGFEWAVHAPIGIAQGLDAEEVERLRVGVSPDFQRADEDLVYRFSSKLLEVRAIDDALYKEATELLGERKVVDLVSIVGYYSFICMTINVFTIAVPDGLTNPF